MLHLETAWKTLEKRFAEVAEGTGDDFSRLTNSDRELVALGLVNEDGVLTSVGEEFYKARFVLEDSEQAAQHLGAALRSNSLVNAFCEHLWGAGDIPVRGAVGLLRRLTGIPDEAAAKRWLVVMNAGRVIAYNRNQPQLRILYNPGELVSPQEDAERERDRGHVVAPDTPYGNLLHLRQMIRSARTFIRWYEQHLPPKVMETLYREVETGAIAQVRLLSGPAAIDNDTKSEFKRFKKEMNAKRSVEVEWRVLTRKRAQDIHGRFFISEDFSRNIPPLNSILKGSQDEMLPSNVDRSEFDEWWEDGEDLFTFNVE